MSYIAPPYKGWEFARCGKISFMLLLTVNGIERSWSADATTLAQIVRDLNLEGKRIAVELNGEIVPKSRYSATHLRNGDKLEVVAAVGGG